MNCANHSDRDHVAFCQNCGKPLCQECTRVVGSAVFCEPCLAARLAGNQAGPGAANSPFPPPSAPGEPSPALAFLLGFIPGVGAMYNGQYAKGVVHLIVFAILASLSHDNGIFVLFVIGWLIYQAIEANHTARARLNGTPLPNPFGLNDIGERLGFGKAWPTPPPAPVQDTAQPASSTSAPPAGSYAPPASSYVPPTYTYAPPSYSYPPPASGFVPPASSYVPYSNPTGPNWGAPQDNYQSVPPGAPFNPVNPTDPYAGYPPINPSGLNRRFPTAAIWLIAIGSLFLIANTGLLHGFPVYRLLPFVLIGFGVWVFLRKMTAAGLSLADDGSPEYQPRLARAIGSSAWIVLIGVLWFLDIFNILHWSHSWPLFIIIAGVIALLRRTGYQDVPINPYEYAPPAAPATPPPASTALVPFEEEGREEHRDAQQHNHHDQEGS